MYKQNLKLYNLVRNQDTRRTGMLDSVLAQKLVKRIMKQLGYNVNIMNDKGIIIASGDQRRIGDFHEIAYKIIKDKLDISIANETGEGIGIKSPGVNMPIIYKNQVIGVIGVSGNPEELTGYAQLVKLSVETILEHEFYKEQIRRNHSSRNTFLNALLYEEPINYRRIEKLANELHYEENHFRIPILVSTDYIIGNIFSQIQSIPSHNKQDIPLENGNNRIVIFKTISEDHLFCYKEKVMQYIAEIKKLMSSLKDIGESIFLVGMPQKTYTKYRIAYQQSSWLEEYTQVTNGIYFFCDYILDYMKEQIPPDIYDGVFSSYKGILNNIGNDILDTLEAFYRNRLNVNKTAEALFLHRNTVFFRLKKIKQFMGLDPLNNIYDSQLLFLILHYYKKCIPNLRDFDVR
jgi:Sugar diacid utilization regulator